MGVTVLILSGSQEHVGIHASQTSPFCTHSIFLFRNILLFVSPREVKDKVFKKNDSFQREEPRMPKTGMPGWQAMILLAE